MYIHSFIPLAYAKFNDSMPFSGTSSIPLCYVLFPATLLHQLFFHPFSPHLAIYFLVYLSVLLFPNSYIIQWNLDLSFVQRSLSHMYRSPFLVPNEVHINNVIYSRIHRSPNCRFTAFVVCKSRSRRSISRMDHLKKKLK